MTKGEVIDLSGGRSKVLWQVELRWNLSKTENHAFYWADDVATVNKEAAGVWDELVVTNGITMPDDEEIKANPSWNLDGKQTKPGQPYSGFALLNHHATSLAITVEPVNGQRERRAAEGAPREDGELRRRSAAGEEGQAAAARGGLSCAGNSRRRG